MSTVTLQASQDGQYGVNDGTGTQNYTDTTSATMLVGMYPAFKSSPSGKYYSASQWDLSSIPAGSAFSYAELQGIFASQPTISGNMAVDVVTTAWSESSLPILSVSTNLGSWAYSSGNAAGVYYTMIADSSTMRNLVANWKSGATANNGLRYSDTSSSNSVSLETRTNTRSGTTHGPVLVLTYTAVPGAPTLNSVTKNATKPRVDVAWSAPTTGDAPTSYKVDRATNNTFTAGLVTTNVGNVTNWTDTTTAYSTTYYYRVKANNAAGDGPNSGFLSVTTDANPIQTVIPTGIPSAEAVSPVVVAPGPRNLGMVAIPTAEAVSPVVVAATITSQPVGIASAEAVSPVVVAPGSVTAQPLAIPSEEAFGIPNIWAYVPVGLVAIPSAEVVSPVVVVPGFVALAMVGVPSAEAVSPVVIAIGAVYPQPLSIIGGEQGFRTDNYYDQLVSDDFELVDITKPYLIAGEWRGDPGIGQNHYFGFISYDEDQQVINPIHVYKTPGSVPTTLAADLHVGDAVVHLTDATGWWAGAPDYYHGIGLWPYQGPGGRVYHRDADSYTRNVVSTAYDTIAGNDLHLLAPWALANPAAGSGGVWPAGTEVANLHDGGTYNYILAAFEAMNDDRWVSRSAIIHPFDGTLHDGNETEFRAATKFVKMLFLTNRDVPGGATIYRNLVLRSLTDPTNMIRNGGGELGDLSNFTQFDSFVTGVQPVTIQTTIAAQPLAIPSSEAVSPVVVLPGPVFAQLFGIPSAEAVGLPTYNVIHTIGQVGIPTAEAFGNTFVLARIIVIPVGVPSEEAVSAVVLVMGTVRLNMVGIPTAEAFGIMVVIPPGMIFTPPGTTLDELILMFTPQMKILSPLFADGGLISMGSGGMTITSNFTDGGLVVLSFDLIDSGVMTNA